MGSKQSTPAVTPVSSDASFHLTCDTCTDEDKPVKGWCGQCNVYMCPQCVQKHTRSHRLAVGSKLPLTRPKSKSLIKQVKQEGTLRYVKEEESESVPKEELNIRGCVCIDDYVVAISYQKITLYDADFSCIGDIHFGDCNPNSICARGYDIAVSFERAKDQNNDDNSDANKAKKNGTPFNDIQLFYLNLPSCASDAKLAKKHGFRTEGRCFSISTCPVEKKKEMIIAAGMRIDFHPERDDLEFQVQILKSNGKVMHTLQFNQRGEPCFEGEFFICGTKDICEIVVSEVKQKCVRGVDVRIGKTIFEFEEGNPQGLTMDKENNIYVYNDSAFFWIPPLRDKIYPMMQGYTKKKQKQQKMVTSLSFNDEKRILYVTNVNKDTIETYRVS